MYKLIVRIIGCTFMVAAWSVALQVQEGAMGVADSIQIVGIAIAAAILMR